MIFFIGACLLIGQRYEFRIFAPTIRDEDETNDPDAVSCPFCAAFRGSSQFFRAAWLCRPDCAAFCKTVFWKQEREAFARLRGLRGWVCPAVRSGIKTYFYAV